ncbi:Peroxidase 63 [Linum perenne]
MQALGTPPNLPGDAFDLVVRAKTALELACPNTVSCSDILAVATRDLVTMVGGPFYNIPLGRLDYRVKRSADICLEEGVTYSYHAFGAQRGLWRLVGSATWKQ